MEKLDLYAGQDIGRVKDVDYIQDSKADAIKKRIYDLHEYGCVEITDSQEFPIQFTSGSGKTQIDIGYNANGVDVVGGIVYDKNGERIIILDNEDWQTIDFVYNGKNLKRNSGNLKIPLATTSGDNYVWIEYLLIHDTSNDSETLLENFVILDSGTATSGAASTLTDNTKSWGVNSYQNKYVKIVGGTGIGQTRKITSNTSDTLTITPNWTTPPDATSVYQILDNNSLQYIKRLDGYQIKITTSSTPPSGAGISIYLGKVNPTLSSPDDIDYSNKDLFGQRTDTIKIKPDTGNKTQIYEDGKIGTLLDHINALGGGTPAPNNPHGLTITDIVGAAEEPKNTEFQGDTHSNGIIDTDLNACESSIDNSTFTINNLTISSSSLDLSILGYSTGGQDARVEIAQLVSEESIYLGGIKINATTNLIFPKLIDFTNISSSNAFVTFLQTTDSTGTYKIILKLYYDSVAEVYRALAKKIPVAQALTSDEFLLGTVYWDSVSAILYNSPQLDSGTATSSTNTTLIDTSKVWLTNQYQGNYVTITGGTGSGQVKKIVSNDSDTLTIDSAWAVNPDGTSTYKIGEIDTNGTLITEHPVTNAETGGRRFGTISQKDLWKNSNGNVVIDLSSSIIFRKDLEDKFIINDSGDFDVKGKIKEKGVDIVPTGMMMASFDIPQGWLECNGSTIDKDVNKIYTELVDYLRAKGNYFTNSGALPANQAKLPDLQRRYPIGHDNVDYIVGDAAKSMGGADEHNHSITVDNRNIDHNHTITDNAGNHSHILNSGGPHGWTNERPVMSSGENPGKLAVYGQTGFVSLSGYNPDTNFLGGHNHTINSTSGFSHNHTASSANSSNISPWFASKWIIKW